MYGAMLQETVGYDIGEDLLHPIYENLKIQACLTLKVGTLIFFETSVKIYQ